MATILWNEAQSDIEERAARSEPVLTVVRSDGVKLKEVMLSSEAVEDHGFVECKVVVERKIRAAAARGLRPGAMKVTVLTSDFSSGGRSPSASF